MAPRKTKKDFIAQELMTMIAAGELPRGARVPQDELAARFETSITPVREAMRQLEAQGVLVSEPHRGVRVADANLDEVTGVYLARKRLEPYAAQRATLRVSRRDLAQVDELLDKMEQAHAAGDDTGVREANRELHFFFYDRAGNAALARIIESLWLAFPWDILHVVPGRADESLKEHRMMVGAIRSGDVDEVKRLFELHIERSYLRLYEHLTEQPREDPFKLDVD